MEGAVFRFRHSDPANRAAIDARRGNTDEDTPVEAPIVCLERRVTGIGIENHVLQEHFRPSLIDRSHCTPPCASISHKKGCKFLRSGSTFPISGPHHSTGGKIIWPFSDIMQNFFRIAMSPWDGRSSEESLTTIRAYPIQFAVPHPFHYESSGTAAPRFYLDRGSWAILCASTAFHTGIELDEFRFLLFQGKYLMRADLHAFATTDTFLRLHFKRRNIAQISEPSHMASLCFIKFYPGRRAQNRQEGRMPWQAMQSASPS
jgi:hypothetical protein